jgi:ribosomal protein S18 acetylase RimI-like enzyme
VIEIRPLTGIGFDVLTAAFNDAFSDYPIPANYTVDYLQNLVTRRGFRPDLAVGAFDGERLAGFVFNAMSGEDAYNSGTGVVITHRRQGIARRLMQHSIATLPARTYTLEVIETNEKAAALYRDLGFVETRRLQCWSYEPRQRAHFSELANVDLDALAGWFDMPPTWQNSIASLRRATEPWFVLGDERCAAVVFTSNGDVPLLAVDRAHRRRGLARTLLDAAATRAAKPLRIMNIDDASADITAFLSRCGARRTLRQIEMVRGLKS